MLDLLYQLETQQENDMGPRYLAEEILSIVEVRWKSALMQCDAMLLCCRSYRMITSEC